jgi:hypothetical protein
MVVTRVSLCCIISAHFTGLFVLDSGHGLAHVALQRGRRVPVSGGGADVMTGRHDGDVEVDERWCA